MKVWIVETKNGSKLVALFRNLMDANFFLSKCLEESSSIPLNLREVSLDKKGTITVSFDERKEEMLDLNKVRGSELTCKDIKEILNKSSVGTLDNRHLFRLILERLEFLEDYIERIREDNSLY